MKSILLGRSSAMTVAVTGVLSVALSASASSAPSLTYIESAAMAAVRDGPSGETLTDPTEVLDTLALDPVVRAIKAEAEAARLVGRPLQSTAAPSSREGVMDPLIAAKISSAFSALDDRAPPKVAPAVRPFDFQDYLARAAARKHRPAGQVRRKSPPPPHVLRAINAASARTGVSHGYLWRAASRESSFNPYAKAPTSSAAGLYQFLDSTWLLTVKRHGASYGLGDLAGHIVVDANGEAFVRDPRIRQRILSLRYDASLSAYLAAEFTRENGAALQSYLRRPARDGELYMAHFLGASGATRLLRAAATTPYLPADRLFPRAAAANRSLFYAGGRPRSVASLKLLLQDKGET